ncbi:hypothetical protein O181_000309 [Austropuccinia psidii MF-1]|uniref:Uncharacterized protein n=1 Tax=Austropuccinia psidii MF-1 TaxID=1389203 RepID=A0A9Q3B8C8_9BASI|nr:hypothetical protein [Austropuccinia psidii MF-1]
MEQKGLGNRCRTLSSSMKNQAIPMKSFFRYSYLFLILALVNLFFGLNTCSLEKPPIPTFSTDPPAASMGFVNPNQANTLETSASSASLTFFQPQRENLPCKETPQLECYSSKEEGSLSGPRKRKATALHENVEASNSRLKVNNGKFVAPQSGNSSKRRVKKKLQKLSTSISAIRPSEVSAFTSKSALSHQHIAVGPMPHLNQPSTFMSTCDLPSESTQLVSQVLTERQHGGDQIHSIEGRTFRDIKVLKKTYSYISLLILRNPRTKMIEKLSGKFLSSLKASIQGESEVGGHENLSKILELMQILHFDVLLINSSLIRYLGASKLPSLEDGEQENLSSFLYTTMQSSLEITRDLFYSKENSPTVNHLLWQKSFEEAMREYLYEENDKLKFKILLWEAEIPVSQKTLLQTALSATLLMNYYMKSNPAKWKRCFLNGNNFVNLLSKLAHEYVHQVGGVNSTVARELRNNPLIPWKSFGPSDQSMLTQLKEYLESDVFLSVSKGWLDSVIFPEGESKTSLHLKTFTNRREKNPKRKYSKQMPMSSNLTAEDLAERTYAWIFPLVSWKKNFKCPQNPETKQQIELALSDLQREANEKGQSSGEMFYIISEVYNYIISFNFRLLHSIVGDLNEDELQEEQQALVNYLSESDFSKGQLELIIQPCENLKDEKSEVARSLQNLMKHYRDRPEPIARWKTAPGRDLKSLEISNKDVYLAQIATNLINSYYKARNKTKWELIFGDDKNFQNFLIKVSDKLHSGTNYRWQNRIGKIAKQRLLPRSASCPLDMKEISHLRRLLFGTIPGLNDPVWWSKRIAPLFVPQKDDVVGSSSRIIDVIHDDVAALLKNKDVYLAEIATNLINSYYKARNKTQWELIFRDDKNFQKFLIKVSDKLHSGTNYRWQNRIVKIAKQRLLPRSASCPLDMKKIVHLRRLLFGTRPGLNDSVRWSKRIAPLFVPQKDDAVGSSSRIIDVIHDDVAALLKSGFDSHSTSFVETKIDEFIDTELPESQLILSRLGLAKATINVKQHAGSMKSLLKALWYLNGKFLQLYEYDPSTEIYQDNQKRILTFLGRMLVQKVTMMGTSSQSKSPSILQNFEHSKLDYLVQMLLSKEETQKVLGENELLIAEISLETIASYYESMNNNKWKKFDYTQSTWIHELRQFIEEENSKT